MIISPLNIRYALDTPPPALDFVIPGLLAGSVGTIVGPGAVGKSTLLLQLAVGLATNLPTVKDIFRTDGKPSRIVYIAAEESASILRNRLHSIGNLIDRKFSSIGPLADVIGEREQKLMTENLHLFPAAGDSVCLIKRGEPTDFYDELCRFCKGARLVVVDPLRRLHDGDENSSSAMTQVAEMLESLAKRTDAAVIAAHHMNKNAGFAGNTNAAAASRGSSALTDAVRWQMNMSLMSDQEAKSFDLLSEQKSYLKVEYAKTNYIAPQPVIWLKRLKGGGLVSAHPGESGQRMSSPFKKPMVMTGEEGKPQYV